VSRSRSVILACLLVLVCASTVSAAAGAGSVSTNPTLVEIYPNTNHAGNDGEYLVIEFPTETDLSTFSLTDGKTTTSLGNETVSGTVAFSRSPEITAEKVEHPVSELTDHFAMAQSGETIRLYDGDQLIDETSYERATQSERWVLMEEDWEWQQRGATEFEARDHPAERATAFTLPDSPETPIETLRSADERLYLAGYTFDSEPALDKLIAAHERGVEVRVLVDGTPVGGQSEDEAEALDMLAEAGVEVRIFEGSATRYRFHHPKYAIADDRALVMTENWKPSGTGGESSRGWGTVVESESVADELTAVFEADAGWEDTVKWDRSYAGTLVEDESPERSFSSDFDPVTSEVESIRVVTAPDNAEDETLALLESAEESIRIKQVTIAHDHAFLQEAVAAAERGVEVRILLDSSWYVERENEELVRWIDDQAESGDLPIDARLVEPGEFEKIHAKGVVVDDRWSMVGSINWNANSVENNREVALIVESEEIASYYGEVFDADWEGGERGWSIPVGVGLGVAAAAGVAVLAGSRLIRFDP
jgi:cardiolipin synthase